jgi:hypothetical protein
VWAEAIAGQSFPDYTANPLFDLSLPQLLSGNIARNVGMILGLRGWLSLLPLVGVALLALVVWLRLEARKRAVVETVASSSDTPASTQVGWIAQ